MIAEDVFPVPRSDFHLHLTYEDATLFHAVRGTDLPPQSLGFATYQQWALPQPVARYLARCDGKTAHGEIADTFAPGVPAALGNVLAQQAVLSLEDTGVLSFEAVPAREPSALRVTGGFDSFAPVHMSFEITETCNFRCAHCYVSASPEKHGRKSGAATIEALDKLADSGVVIVELTGGECTTHPEFKDILDHASRRFHLVGVITNGFLIGKRPDLANFIGERKNVVVQVSIDGLEEFHDRFRGMKGSFVAACEAIRSLKRHGTFVRLGMSVTTDNLDQVLGVYHVAKELGVDALGVAAVTSFGRGAEINGCSSVEHYVNHKLNDILGPYTDDPLFDALKRERGERETHNEINCGAGWRSFALNSDGTVRSCLFLADSKKFGNLDRQDYDEVFRQPEMRMFHDAPSPGGPECTGPQPDGSPSCKHVTVCIGCFAKAFRISEEQYPECPWRARYFPGMSLAPPPLEEMRAEGPSDMLMASVLALPLA